MSVTQISIFLENKMGQLAEVTQWMGEKGVNLRAVSIADSQDFGILRIIAEHPDRLLTVLNEKGYTAIATEVLAVAITDQPGGMAKVLSVLSEHGVDVEYTYAFLSRKEQEATMVFRVNDNETAKTALTAEGIRVIGQQDLF
ncbi:MAG: amino acid-binding protein [Clostridia bacterium]|nr:amino acid-binding protein [Clostridia bacterium]